MSTVVALFMCFLGNNRTTTWPKKLRRAVSWWLKLCSPLFPRKNFSDAKLLRAGFNIGASTCLFLFSFISPGPGKLWGAKSISALSRYRRYQSWFRCRRLTKSLLAENDSRDGIFDGVSLCKMASCLWIRSLPYRDFYVNKTLWY